MDGRDILGVDMGFYIGTMLCPHPLTVTASQNGNAVRALA